MGNFKSYRDHSKTDWGTESQPSLEQVATGAILRIADALDVMKRPFANLVEDRERYERYYKQGIEREKRMAHQISGLRGYIKRMKKK